MECILPLKVVIIINGIKIVQYIMIHLVEDGGIKVVGTYELMLSTIINMEFISMARLILSLS